MDLFALNEKFEVLTPLIPDNVQWNSKYYEPGNFAIQIPKKDYSPAIKYIYIRGRDELGIVQKFDYSESSSPDAVLLSGKFIEEELNDKIIYPTFYADGEIVKEITRMISENKSDIPLLEIGARQFTGRSINFQETFGSLGTVAQERLKSQEFGQRILYNFETNKKIYEIYKGTDRTASQSTVPQVVFSTDFNNVYGLEYMEDSSKEKNLFVIAGAGENENRIIVTYQIPNNYRKIQFIDAKSVSYDSKKQTLDQYRANLLQYGIEKSLSYKKIQNANFMIDGSGYIYRKDYFLGDKVTVILQPLQIILDVRIIGIYEVFKDGMHTIELELGDKVLKNYEKERMNTV